MCIVDVTVVEQVAVLQPFVDTRYRRSCHIVEQAKKSTDGVAGNLETLRAGRAGYLRGYRKLHCLRFT